MRVLVTGGAGFVGSHLCERLVARGDFVIVVDDLSNGSLENLKNVKNEITFLKKDISKVDLTGWDKVDVIYHLACWPRSRSFADPIRDVEVNLIGTLNILEYARRVKARIIFSSNSGISGPPIKIWKCPECGNWISREVNKNGI